MTSVLETHLLAQTEAARHFFWHRLRWRALTRWLPHHEPFTLVDVGAGAGLLREYLAAEFPGATYRFVEPLPRLREALSARAGLEADWTDRTDFRGAHVLAFLDVLEHQPDDEGALRDLARKCDPGARLLLTVPALPALWSGWDVALGHHRRYTKPSLRAALARSPFALEHVQWLFPEMLPLAGWRRLRVPAARAAEAAGAASAEFPALPRSVNDALYALGRVSLALGARTPIGTSLLAVARSTK